MLEANAQTSLCGSTDSSERLLLVFALACFMNNMVHTVYSQVRRNVIPLISLAQTGLFWYISWCSYCCEPVFSLPWQLMSYYYFNGLSYYCNYVWERCSGGIVRAVDYAKWKHLVQVNIGYWCTHVTHMMYTCNAVTSNHTENVIKMPVSISRLIDLLRGNWRSEQEHLHILSGVKSFHILIIHCCVLSSRY